MKTTNEIFKSNLRRLRKNRFPSQESFAEKVGLSLRGYQKYEQGESSPTPEILDRFSEALDCQPWQLLKPDGEAVGPRKVTAESLTQSLTVLDAAECLRQLATISPERRAVVLGFLFDDHSFFPNDVGSSLEPVFSQLHGANG